MAAYTVCQDPKCATLVEGKVAACPKCGGAMRTVGESPWRGIVLLLCGLTLVIGMGLITYYMYPALTNPGVDLPGGPSSGAAVGESAGAGDNPRGSRIPACAGGGARPGAGAGSARAVPANLP